ncbi:hypothetical protein JOD54_003870 [Actinokineospora baliensis]|uniref:hypothetical protein n=1 Tax=Actinokineospora baliensis TaxID=547056 RepID=UPI001957E7D5|nr:hypothetical protein [Actinokineospora baliensis]MBM7773666.1 hypothetical protein [Actinokineospora baliensis]
MRVLAVLVAGVVLSGCGGTTGEPAPVVTTSPKAYTSAGLVKAAFVAEDLVDVGVPKPEGVTDAALLAGCAGSEPVAKMVSLWTLTDTKVNVLQSVESYDDAGGLVAGLRSEVPDACLLGEGGKWSTGPILPNLVDIDAAYSWCYIRVDVQGCGAAAARGNVVTVVLVEGTPLEAELGYCGKVVARLVPVAVKALGRV